MLGGLSAVFFCLDFAPNVVADAVPDGRLGLAGMKLGDEIRQGIHLFRKPGDVLADLLFHMGIAGTDGLEAVLSGIAQSGAAGLHVSASV